MQREAKAIVQGHLEETYHLGHLDHVGGQNVERPDLDTKRGPITPCESFSIQRFDFARSHHDAGASINTSNIGNSALIIEELDWGGQDALNTCEDSFFGPHLGLGRQKNVVRLGQTPDMELPY